MDLFTSRYFDKANEVGIVPVVCPKNESELLTLLDAVKASPVRCVEITLRNAYSTEAIAYIKKNCPDITVGAGTVNSLAGFEKAMSAGADFLVSPGTLDESVEQAKIQSVPFLHGCVTPSEILKLTSQGYTTLKFFPAEGAGGVKTLNLYAGAFADVHFIPTGGITVDNLGDYLKCKNVLACGGSFMAPKELLAAGDREGVYKLIEKCVAIRKESRK